MAVITSKQIIKPSLPASITITGSGNKNYCYVTINDIKYTTATSDIKVKSGDTILFAVYGYSTTYYGQVLIDSKVALKSTGKTTLTTQWIVPSNIETITIAMTYISPINTRSGKIVVTTS